MVHTPAPNSRRFQEKPSSAAWTNRFHQASASRLNRRVSLGTLLSSAFLLSGSLSVRSEANPPGLPPVFSSKNVAPRTVAPVSVSTEITPSVTSPVDEASGPKTVSQPIVSQVVKHPDGTFHIATPATISAVTTSAVTTSAPVPILSAVPPTASAQHSPSQPLAPVSALHQSLQPQSQPVSAPALQIESGARGKNAPAVAGIAASIVVPSLASPSPVTKIAPLPESAVSRAKTPEAVPMIQVRAILGGVERQAQIAVTPKMTVGQALAAMGISLAVLDRVTPDASALVRDGLSMRVTRIASELRKTRKSLPAELRYQPTTKIRAGAKSTLQEAKAGTLEITERVWTRDGKVTKREFVSQRIASQPRHKIVALGVNSHIMPSNVRPHRRYARALGYRGGTPRDRSLAPADPRTFAPIKSMIVLSTGYSAGPAGGAIGNWTATGVRCTYGTVAVDPRLIPLGSKLYIEGYGYGFACDTGGAIKGRHIDLAFNSPSAAFRHGKRKVKVWILGP